jgi:N-acetylglucosamine-6-phosphate deacetylase
MATTLLYTKMLTPAELNGPGVMLISDEGRIEYIGPAENAPQLAGERLELHDLIVAPGFIDVHVHGGNGVTFGETGDAAAELRAYSGWVVSSGVTGFLCSLAAADSQALAELVDDYVDAMQAGVPGAEPLGIHLEGPFINRERKAPSIQPGCACPPSQRPKRCWQPGEAGSAR